MTLAGFEASKGPEAFRRLAAAAGDERRRHGGEALIASLGCTHPDSQRRWGLLGGLCLVGLWGPWGGGGAARAASPQGGRGGPANRGGRYRRGIEGGAESRLTALKT
jgi:hypothetical protein